MTGKRRRRPRWLTRLSDIAQRRPALVIAAAATWMLIGDAVRHILTHQAISAASAASDSLTVVVICATLLIVRLTP